LSPIEGTGRRPTAQIAKRRNQFVGALAAAAFVAYADTGGKTEAFAKDFMGVGKPIYTFQSQYNEPLLEIGAKPVDTKLLAQWAASWKK
jgi:predicted Rossmann fold nucleotide-binding protein DprA/Smf involved in DNA uptake